MAVEATQEGHTLLGDGSLRLEVETDLEPLIRRWLPQSLLPFPAPSARATPARIQVLSSPAPLIVTPSRAPRPLLRISSVRAWSGLGVEELLLSGESGVGARIRLEDREAMVGIWTHTSRARSKAAEELYVLLTICAALLLGRNARTLVHAAGVVDPEERGWLLVGDARVGKSTTTVNLIGAGWDFLTDDQIVLSSAPAAESFTPVRAEGWFRPFHLDEGWHEARPGKRRVVFDPRRLGSGRPRRIATVAGLLFPRLAPELPTTVRLLSDTEALCMLVRQTPWLLADRRAAPTILALLERAVRLPTFELRLGLDSYRDSRRLLGALAPVLEAAERSR